MKRRRPPSVAGPGDAADELSDFTSDPKRWLFGKLTDRKGRANEALRAEVADAVDAKLSPLVLLVLAVGFAYAMRRGY